VSVEQGGAALFAHDVQEEAAEAASKLSKIHSKKDFDALVASGAYRRRSSLAASSLPWQLVCCL
jgi:3-polyprenyl-4-hydroxybenzoate decarboxylase